MTKTGSFPFHLKAIKVRVAYNIRFDETANESFGALGKKRF